MSDPTPRDTRLFDAGAHWATEPTDRRGYGDALRDAVERAATPGDRDRSRELAERDDERRWDIGDALGWELEDESPSWAEIMRGIADLRALAAQAETEAERLAERANDGIDEYRRGYEDGAAAFDRTASSPAQGPAETERRPMRVGRKLGRTLYCQHGADPSADDTFVGIMESEPLARRVVDCVNWLNGTAPAGPQAEGAGEADDVRRVLADRGYRGDDEPVAVLLARTLDQLGARSADPYGTGDGSYPGPSGGSS